MEFNKRKFVDCGRLHIFFNVRSHRKVVEEDKQRNTVKNFSV